MIIARDIIETPRPRYDSEEMQASYTRPRPGITPAGAAFVGSWGMNQALDSAGHLETQNGQTVVVLHAK